MLIWHAKSYMMMTKSKKTIFDFIVNNNHTGSYITHTDSNNTIFQDVNNDKRKIGMECIKLEKMQKKRYSNSNVKIVAAALLLVYDNCSRLRRSKKSAEQK